MGYFDGLTNAWFKKTDGGKTIFYPYGRFGSKGYILSKDSEENIRKFLKRYNMISLFIIILSVYLFGLYTFILLFFFIPFYSIKMRRLLSNAEKTQEKMKFNEVIKNMAVAMGVRTSIVMFVGALLMTSAAIFCIFMRGARLISILGTLFFGLCLLQSIFLIRYSVKYNRKNRQDA